MGIRPKLFLVFFACGVVPMLIFAVINYRNGERALADLLRRDVEREAQGVANSIETALRERENGLMALARLRSLHDYVSGAARSPAAPEPRPRAAEAPPNGASTLAPFTDAAGDELPTEVRAGVEAFLLNNRNDYVALACLDANRRPLFRAEPAQRETAGSGVRYQTADFLASSIVPDPRVWTTAEQLPLRSTQSQEASGTTVRYTLPIFSAEPSAQAARGALVVDLKLNSLCKAALNSFADLPATPRLFVILDRDGRIVYHSNEALTYQPIKGAMPSFEPVAKSMLAGESGEQMFDSPDGNRWLVSYQPVTTAGLFLAAAGSHTVALGGYRRPALLNISLSALAGLMTAVLLTLIARRMELSIQRVTAGAVAIAGGQLDQRIVVHSSDETHLLAESFNQMTDRLREQIAYEAETKQFESFMRLSAMLTHDLKNSITALSLVVSNMEQKFDKEEFRAEAMESLKEATDKLRLLVAKLSGPVESLSGEYQRPRPTDLVPYLKRALAATAEAQTTHRVEVHLPATLVAVVDADRIERVFENLVINALEAMGSKSGTLTVEAGPSGAGEVFFSVADTGPGISEDYQRTRLFRAFATTKRKGVGLGLYTCREVVRAHSGRIDVESSKGAGATFRVVLPSGGFTEGK